MARTTQSLGDDVFAPPRTSSWLRWLRLIGIVAACGATGAGIAMQMPVAYRAETTLEYAQDPSGVVKGGGPSAILSTDEWYNTQDFLLRSRAVSDAVAKQLRLHEDRGFFGLTTRQPLRKSIDEAGARLRSELNVQRIPNTRLVKVEVSDTNSKRAAKIANAVADVYLQQSLESRVESQRNALSWLADQIDRTSADLARTEDELQAKLETSDAPPVPVAQQQDILVTEIKNLSQTVTDARVRRIELAARVAKLKAAQSENPFEVHSAEVDENDQVKQLAADYQATFIKFRELEATGTTGPALDAEQSRLRILTERMRVAITGVLKTHQAELTQAQSIETQLQASLREIEQRAADLQKHQLEFGRIERERAENAELLVTLRERSTAIGIASASGAANARVVERAVAPEKALGQPWWLGALVGVLVGVLLAAVVKRVGKALAPPRVVLRG